MCTLIFLAHEETNDYRYFGISDKVDKLIFKFHKNDIQTYYQIWENKWFVCIIFNFFFWFKEKVVHATYIGFFF